MRKGTLADRFAGIERPARVVVTIPVGTLVRLEGLAGQMGLGRRDAVREAVGAWVVARETALNRQHRLAVERGLREAMDRQPLEDVLRNLRAALDLAAQAGIGSP